MSLEPTPITFSVDADADADRVSSVLVALGFAPTRVARDGSSVGLSLEQLAARYKLNVREVNVVKAMLCGADDSGAYALALGVSGVTARWIKRSLLNKTAAADRAELLSMLREVPEGYVIRRTAASEQHQLVLGGVPVNELRDRAALAAVAWRAILAPPRSSERVETLR